MKDDDDDYSVTIAVPSNDGQIYGMKTLYDPYTSVNISSLKKETEDEIKKRVASEIKRVILINRASPESQVTMIMENPDVYDLIIDPCEEATQAYILKTEL